MSLQAWYPFNGNYENQGLGDLDLTVTTSPSYTTGKVTGQALNLGGFKWTAEQSAKVLNNKALSICFWLKPTQSSGTNIIFGQQSPNRRFCIFTYPTLNDLHLDWRYNDAGSYMTAYVSNGFFPTNVWTHCTVTFEYPNIIKIYKNGVLHATETGKGTMNISNFAYDTTFANISTRCINDFRVYDHCLSPKEVKEISKGLMLHYPLNNNGFGCKNLLAGNFNAVATQEGNSHSGSLWIHADNIGGSFNNLIGKTLIFSYEVSAEGSRYYVNTGDLRPRFGIHGTIQYVANGNSATVYPFADYLMYSGGARKVVMKYTIPSTWTSISNFVFALQDTNRPAAGNTATWYIKNCKLEIADEATPWCPNQRDELYSQLGMDENIEYDVSGYGNNAMKTSVNYNSNSPRYQTSTVFDGTTSGIELYSGIINSILAQGGNNPFTYSFWIKNAAIDRGIIFGDHKETASNAFISIEKHLQNELRFYWNNGYIDWFCTNTTLPLNTWVHIVITYNGSKLSVYKNGILTDSKTITLTVGNKSSDNCFQIGRDSRTNNTMFEGNLSDFRIYATCLSETDIQELYNKPISIDNSGNLFAQEIIEEVSSASKFEKSGIVKADNISRCLYNYFTYNNTAMQIQSVNSKVSLTKLLENNGFKLTCNSALSSEAMTRTQQLLFNGASGQFKVEFDAWATNSVTIVPDICDRDSGTYTLTSVKQHFSGVASNVNSYNTSSAYNGFFDIKCSGTVSAGTEIYITNIVISKNTPKSVGNNFIIMDEIIEN